MPLDSAAFLYKGGSASAQVAVLLLYEFAAEKPESLHRILKAAAKAGVCRKRSVPRKGALAGELTLLTFLLAHPAVLPTIFADSEFLAYFRERSLKGTLPTSRAPSDGSSSPVTR
jgi:hypothetical protein